MAADSLGGSSRRAGRATPLVAGSAAAAAALAAEVLLAKRNRATDSDDRAAVRHCLFGFRKLLSRVAAEISAEKPTAPLPGWPHGRDTNRRPATKAPCSSTSRHGCSKRLIPRLADGSGCGPDCFGSGRGAYSQRRVATVAHVGRRGQRGAEHLAWEGCYGRAIRDRADSAGRPRRSLCLHSAGSKKALQQPQPGVDSPCHLHSAVVVLVGNMSPAAEAISDSWDEAGDKMR
jgi:hypothetical protein